MGPLAFILVGGLLYFQVDGEFPKQTSIYPIFILFGTDLDGHRRGNPHLFPKQFPSVSSIIKLVLDSGVSGGGSI